MVMDLDVDDNVISACLRETLRSFIPNRGPLPNIVFPSTRKDTVEPVCKFTRLALNTIANKTGHN